MEAILAQVIAVLDSALGSASIIAVVLEFALRLVPSAKPLGILHLIGAGLKGVGMVALKAGELLDKVLPQKIAAPKQ